MVARLWGTCQGQQVTFQPGADGRWTCRVPASPTGAYSLQLWAEDLAGNVGYLATIRLAFDPAGHRVGYGGGFYDKFLAQEPEHPTLALCYGFQLFPCLETDPHDVPVDQVLWAQVPEELV